MISHASVSSSPAQNDLLAALSPKAQQRLFPLLELHHLALGRVLYEQGDPIKHVYFPAGAILSMQHPMQGGTSTEISMVGREGCVGTILLLGGKISPCRAVVQGPGNAYRLPAKDFQDEFNRQDELLRLALHYTQTLITHMTQTAICNQYHTLDQQLCRWLLVALDRIPNDHLHMTQILNVNMLGVSRKGVAEAAKKLHDFGVIHYDRGYITALKRPQLEALSCECYGVVKAEVQRLLGNVVKKRSTTLSRRSAFPPPKKSVMRKTH